MIAFSAAFGISIHNLGEGLTVGSAYAIGNLALGATLVVGFMIHNVTEALPIVTPLATMRLVISKLVLLGLLASAPAIAGTLIGGFAFSPIWSVFFLGIGAGAIFQVAIEVAVHMGKKDLNALFLPHSATGFLSGFVVMYATGLIIVG
jgi:zinc transporter ZupT